MYESMVLDKFKREFPDAILKHNQRIKGLISGRSRQIDILVEGKVLHMDIRGVIECKYLNKKIDIPIIEAFISFLEDVGANVGFLITNIGFTKAAKKRATHSIKIEVITLNELEDYYFSWWDSCEGCSREIHWENGQKAKCKSQLVNIEIGHCSYCGTMHLTCSKCSHIIMIDDNYNQVHECACGNELIVKNNYIGSGMTEESVYLKCGNRQIKFVTSKYSRGDL